MHIYVHTHTQRNIQIRCWKLYYSVFLAYKKGRMRKDLPMAGDPSLNTFSGWLSKAIQGDHRTHWYTIWPIQPSGNWIINVQSALLLFPPYSWIHLLFWVFFPPQRIFTTHFCKSQSKSSPALTGPSIQMSHGYITVCAQVTAPSAFSLPRQERGECLIVEAAGFGFIQRRAKRCSLEPWRLIMVLTSTTWTQDHFTCCPNMCSFAVPGHQRNLMVNHKLLPTPPSDSLGIIGSSTAIFPFTPLKKVQAEECHR